MNKKIKISHEVPLYILNRSVEFNDYDYCLPHLLDQHEEYEDFFLKSRDTGRHIMMDNSLHELGVPYSEDRLLHWLDELKPQEFFVPDYWEDKTRSIVSAKKWSSIQHNFSNITFIAVIQAKSIAEAAECYQTYKDFGYDKIAFSYGALYYNEISSHPNKTLGKALGRIQVISKLREWDIINDNDRIHLLGCSVPQEFGWYKNLPYIESLDTSNPVMAGIEGLEYSTSGLYKKPTANMNTVFENKRVNIDLIKYNIKMFKQINDI
jgi:hypothetical protein